jgi:hypothetical protein
MRCAGCVVVAVTVAGVTGHGRQRDVDIGQLARQYTVGEVDPVRATLQAYFKTRTNVSAFRRAAPRALRDESDNLAAAPSASGVRGKNRNRFFLRGERSSA